MNAPDTSDPKQDQLVSTAPTSLQDTSSTPPKTGMMRSFWRAPTESKSVAINSLMTILTFILALFAYMQWKVSRDSVIVAQQSLAVANETLRDARAGAATAEERANRMTKANEDLAAAAKVQASAGLVSAQSGQRAARAAEKSSNIAQDAFNVGMRPSLGVVGPDLTALVAGKSVIASVVYRNSGNQPARNFTGMTYLFFERGGDAGKCPPPQTKFTTQGSLQSQTVIPINGERPVYFDYKEYIFTEPIIRDIAEGKMKVFIYGKAEYRGLSNSNKYFIEYYGRFNPTSRTFDDCQRNNGGN